MQVPVDVEALGRHGVERLVREQERRIGLGDQRRVDCLEP